MKPWRLPASGTRGRDTEDRQLGLCVVYTMRYHRMVAPAYSVELPRCANRITRNNKSHESECVISRLACRACASSTKQKLYKPNFVPRGHLQIKSNCAQVLE